MSTPSQRDERPPILLADSKADGLYDLAIRLERRHPLSARPLLGELQRSVTLRSHELPEDVVTMGSHVVFLDREGGQQHTVTRSAILACVASRCGTAESFSGQSAM